MGVLDKSRHEQFAQLVARGERGCRAYVALWGEAKGAGQSASRLLRNAQISSRIAELRREISQNLLADTILERRARLQALECRHKMLMSVITERGSILGKLNLDGAPLAEADQSDAIRSAPAPGASTGLVCLDWRGKDAVRAVWKVDTGTLAELRAIEEQAARELGEWNPDPGTTGGNTAVQVNVTFVSPACPA